MGRTDGTRTRSRLLVCAATLLGLCAAFPQSAAAEPRWTLRAGGVWVGPSGDRLRAQLPGGEAFRFELDDGVGVMVELEYRWTSRFGLEATALSSDLDADLTISSGGANVLDTESSRFELFSLGSNYHLRPTRHTDLHAGLFAAITYFDDVVFFTELGRSDKLVFDDDVGFGAKIGLDLILGNDDRWSASLGLRYLRTILEGEAAGQDMDLDPVLISIGIGYRF